MLLLSKIYAALLPFPAPQPRQAAPLGWVLGVLGRAARPPMTEGPKDRQNAPFKRTRPVALGLAAATSATPILVLSVEVVVHSFSESSQ